MAITAKYVDARPGSRHRAAPAPSGWNCLYAEPRLSMDVDSAVLKFAADRKSGCVIEFTWSEIREYYESLADQRLAMLAPVDARGCPASRFVREVADRSGTHWLLRAERLFSEVPEAKFASTRLS